ncbi:MAG: hypothetical protein MUF23_03175 [Pirellula sp.]|nr:hypothetical protein [Pirellula sp.]
MSPLELQRILDGEIDHATRAQLLRSLGDDVQQWRTLALAMIEEQQWSKEIRKDPFGATANDGTASLHGHVKLGPPSVALSSLSDSGSPGPGLAGRFYTHGLTALAASLLLCMGIAGGMWYRSMQSNEISSPLVVGVGSAAPSSSPIRVEATPGTSREFQTPMKMVLAGLDPASPSAAEIPLMDAQKIDPNWVMARDNYELAELKQQLKRRGYRLEVQPKLYSGRLNDGSHVVVPVHNVALKTVGL